MGDGPIEGIIQPALRDKCYSPIAWKVSIGMR
jgi:hypothetical protein